MAQLPFAFRRSIATPNKCVVSCLSLSNAPLTVSCNGQTKTINTGGGDATWTAVGTDAPAGHPANGSQLGYIASITLTSLTGGENYTYSVTQGGATQTANIYVLPDGSLTDFALFANTCDNNTSIGGSAPGYYQYMRQYAQASDSLPVPGILHIDDHYGYPDLSVVDDEAGTGHYHISKYAGGTAADGVTLFSQGDFAAATMFGYDYALGIFAAFGLLQNASNSYVAWGHDEDIQWCYQNLGVLPQWGDHDCGANEMGWDILSAGDIRFTNAKALWDLVMKPLVATEIAATQSADTTAYHWAKTLGPIRVVAPDAITNGSGDAATPLDAGNGPTTVFGANQIADIKAALNTTDEFKLLLLANGIRYMYADATLNKYNAIAQNPLADEVPTEYASLFTANDGASVMSNPHTNGVLGALVTLHGDVHLCSAVKHQNISGAVNEWFYSLSVGTGTGSVNFANAFNLQAGDTHTGSTLEMVKTAAVGTTNNGNDFYGCRIDVIASQYPKELRIGLYDKNNAELWRKKLVSPFSGNGFKAVSAQKEASVYGLGASVGGD